AEDCIRDRNVTGVQTCALPIYLKFVISTHQALFYNVLYNEIRFDRRIKKKVFYVMKATDEIEDEKQFKYLLTDVEGDSPFGYHLRVREELRKAIQDE